MKATTNLMLVALLGVFCERPALSQQVSTAGASTRNVVRILGLPHEETIKCGTSALIYAYSHWNQLAPTTRQQIQNVAQRPSLQTYRLSPSKRFRIHYDTSAVIIAGQRIDNTPALLGPDGRRLPNSYEQYIDSVAYYFDYVWKLEVDTLGYPAPPQDGSQGGGPEYDVYVEELGIDLFGQTTPDSLLEDGPRQRYTTYIEIDNDFQGYRTPGMAGLQVTAAHEFHHSIQLGDYGYWTTVPNYDFWFYELTSVWMEHVAFPAVHDYYFYLPYYFQRFRDGLNRSLSFDTYSSPYFGYERTIWAHFLAKRFGRDIIKSIWTGMLAAPVLKSTSTALAPYGTTLDAEFALFSSWNYYTADRADPQRYYDEGKNYPRFVPNISTTFTGLSASVSSAANPLSTQFYQIALSSDTITAIVTNVNAAGALDPNPSAANLSLSLSATDLQPPYQKVARGLGLTFSASDMSQWRTLYLQSSTRSNANVAPDPSPNPLRLSQDQKLILSVGDAPGNEGDVYLLNSALELKYTHRYPITQAFGNRYLEVPTSDLRGEVSTGVYFIVAKCGDAEFKWKVAIIR